MQSRSSSRLLACGAVAIFAGLLSTAPAVAADSHRHDTHAAVLQLDHGARWQTDAALRTGMEAIRDALARAIPQVHAGRFDAVVARLARDRQDRESWNAWFVPGRIEVLGKHTTMAAGPA